jgi:hypothetical protein
VPITLFLVVMLDTFPETRWLASLMGSSSPSSGTGGANAEVNRTT